MPTMLTSRGILKPALSDEKFMRSSNFVARRFLSGHTTGAKNGTTGPSGAWPSVFNLATTARIEANATCGRNGREEYCREHNSPRGRSAQCGVCDDHSPDPNKRHPIQYAIDGNNDHWWQSPSLTEGAEFESISVTLDLGQIYEVAYVIIRAGASPRPAAWALEYSVDGDNFQPWQFFGRTSSECQDLFGLPATQGKPKPSVETTCTMFHSKTQPLENGEVSVHTNYTTDGDPNQGRIVFKGNRTTTSHTFPLIFVYCW
ncbi:laminin subunit alpha-1-like [Arctopsyche grandis]|uniref:laminin subunit alpha-1-like n=1 Tax=Arctopsyche grandis TaxID=121162 RepID=UPI00406D6F4E